MSDLKIQGVVEVSTEGAESSLNRVGSAAESMARKVGTSADQAGKAVDSIGDGAGKSAEEFTRAEGKIVNSIKRATTQLEQLGKTASQKLDLKISTQGLDAAKFEPMLTKLRELEAAQARVGVGSRGMGSQLQNTSYQLQDFIVQVNGGVDATKALGMQLPQMLVGFGAAGAAIGVVAALLPNIVQLMKSTADSAKTFDASMSDLSKAIGEVGSTVKSFDMEKLYEQFNNSSAAVRAATIEQIKFQQALIQTRQIQAESAFGKQVGSISDYSTLGKITGSSATDDLARKLGLTKDAAIDLLPALNGVKNGTEDVSLVLDKFGRVLLKGNPAAVELAQSLYDLAKSQKDSAAASSAASEAQERMAKGHVTTKKEADEATKAREKAAKAAEAEAKALENLMDRIYGKDTGLDAGYWNDLERLNNEFKRTGDVDKYADAVGRLTMQQKFYTDELKAQQEIEASRAKYMQSVDDETQKLIEKAKAAEYENSLIGKSADEIGRLTSARYDHQIAILQEKAATIELFDAGSSELASIKARIDALAQLRDAEVTKPKLQAQAREWEKFTDQINQSLTDALYRSFESGESFGKTFAKNLQNTFKSMVLKFAVQATMTTGGNLLNSAINYVAGTSGDNGGAGTNYLGLASNANSIYNLANGSTYSAVAGAYSYGSTALGYTYGTNALSQQSLMLAAQDSGVAGSGGSLGSMSASTVAWIGAIIMGMYMSSEAWKAGYRTDGNQFSTSNPNSWGNRIWDVRYEIQKALFGKDFAGSEFSAVMGGSSLSLMVNEYLAQITGNNGAPKTNVNTRFAASGTNGITANPIDNGSTAYAGGQVELANSIFNPLVRLAAERFAASDIFDVTLAGHINNQGRSSNQKLGEVLQGGDQIYRYRTESGQGMADFNNFVNDQIPKMQLAIIAEAMRDSSADYKGVVDMVLGTSKDLTDVIGSMSQWDIAGTVQALFGIADAFDNVKLGLDGLPVAFSDLATVADYARTNAAAAVEQVKAQITSATKDGDTAAVESLTTQLKALQTAAAETDIAAVTRVISETQAFTGVLDLMGKSLSDVFNASNSSQIFALSEALVNMFGTVDALTTAVNGYVENFYSAEEKRALQVENIQKRLAQAGLNYTTDQISGASRETFRAVVESLDLTTTAGQAAFKALMDVQAAFSSIAPAAEDAAAAIESLRASAAATFSSLIDGQTEAAQSLASAQLDALQSSVSAEIDQINVAKQAMLDRYAAERDAQLSALEASVSAYQTQRAAASSIASEMRSFQDSMVSAAASAGPRMSYALAQQQLVTAATAARDTGSLPHLKEISAALDAARGISANQYASVSEMLRDQAITSDAIASMGKVAGDQASAAERTVTRLDALITEAEASRSSIQAQYEQSALAAEQSAQTQIDHLQSIYDAAKEQLDAINGVSTATYSVAEAVANLQTAIAGIVQARTDTSAGIYRSAAGAAYSASTDTWSMIGGVGDVTTSAVQAFISSTLARTGGAFDLYTAAQTAGVSLADVNRLAGWADGTAEDWARKNNLPVFDVGTNRVPRDTLAFVHQNEAIIPAPFNPWANDSAGSNSANLERLVESLTAEVQRLQGLVNEGNQHARRTADATNGNPERIPLVEVK